MSQLFSSLTLRGVTLRNRIAMSPMCMYSTMPGGRRGDVQSTGARRAQSI
jgi:2,4-dienoyl-CoA reductase-like NADH-dependent reductase (Old Yellow Enzyme family)